LLKICIQIFPVHQLIPMRFMGEHLVVVPEPTMLIFFIQ
jgi:hypothetical protein